MEASSGVDDCRDRWSGGPGPGWLVAVAVPGALTSFTAVAGREGDARRQATAVNYLGDRRTAKAERIGADRHSADHE
jgi:hypothetical protein